MDFKNRSLMMLILLTIISTVYADQRIGIDSSPIVNMTEYNYTTRSLDCWQCFEANGKMCTLRDTKESMLYLTGTTNRGYGLCCSPNSTEEVCNTNEKMICS